MLSSTESIVGKIWAELLQVDQIQPQDNFFEMGGDSLMALTMLFQIGDVLGVEIRLETLMDAPTLRVFCQALDNKKSPASVETQNEAEIVPCPRDCPLSVSFIQEQVVGAELAGWYDPDQTKSHCLTRCYRIEGAIDIPALDKALCEIVRRHEILRTGYSVTDGTIFQNVNAAPQSLLHVEDLCHLEQGERELETERILSKIGAFSFFRDKLMICATLITGETEHILAVLVNHVAIDGLSMVILQDELFKLYQAFSHRVASPLFELPIQYADFAHWERQYFSGDRLEAKLAYWRQLARKPLDTTLPVDHTPTVFSYAGGTVPVTISPELTARLRQLASERKVTLFTVLFAAFIALIHAFSGYRYNFFCIPVANRLRKEIRAMIGCFMNFQFVYIDLSGNPTFLELVERLDRTLRDVYENYVPFHFITRVIPPQGAVVDFQLLTTQDESMPPEGFFPFKLQPQKFALFPIDVYLQGVSETITGHFKYQTAAYDRSTILDMVNDYMSLLTNAAHGLDMRLDDMSIKPHSSTEK